MGQKNKGDRIVLEAHMGLPQGQAYDKKKKKDEAGKGN
jgi:hypothetical protein